MSGGKAPEIITPPAKLSVSTPPRAPPPFAPLTRGKLTIMRGNIPTETRVQIMWASAWHHCEHGASALGPGYSHLCADPHQSYDVIFLAPGQVGVGGLR